MSLSGHKRSRDDPGAPDAVVDTSGTGGDKRCFSHGASQPGRQKLSGREAEGSSGICKKFIGLPTKETAPGLLLCAC